MDLQSFTTAITQVGAPLVILFWVLNIAGKKQNDMCAEMKAMTKSINDLTIEIRTLVATR